MFFNNVKIRLAAATKQNSEIGEIMIAKNIIENDESAVVILTDDAGCKFFDGGFAVTGDWLISKDFAVDKAIIYKRDKQNNRNDVFLGTPLDVYPSKRDRRFVIRLSDVNYVGTTENNWCEFTGSKKGANNPVKYVNKERSKTDKNSLPDYF